MATTRRKNSAAEYRMELRQNEGICSNRTAGIRTRAHANVFPDAGIFMGRAPMGVVASNTVDLESSLRGIGAADPTQSVPAPAPQMVSRDPVSFFDRMPLIVPAPLVVHTNQRPVIP
jgi:hypothetical protein